MTPGYRERMANNCGFRPASTPGSCVPATIRSLSSAAQRRRRSLPPMISIAEFDIALRSTLQWALRSIASACPPAQNKAALTGR